MFLFTDTALFHLHIYQSLEPVYHNVTKSSLICGHSSAIEKNKTLLDDGETEKTNSLTDHKYNYDLAKKVSL